MVLWDAYQPSACFRLTHPYDQILWFQGVQAFIDDILNNTNIKLNVIVKLN